MADVPRFIEIDYTGTVEGQIFDTTRAQDAPAGSKGPFGPVVVKLGSGQLIPGLDAFLSDKTSGEYQVTLEPEQAFGKKRADLLKLVPVTAFGKEKERLAPGMPVTIGESQGYVKSVSSGRVVVDFNHPLASKQVSYSILVHGLVTDPKKKVQAVVNAIFGMPLPVEMKDDKVVLKLPKGFPADELVKEIEKHTGVAIVVEEIEIKQDQHVHADGSVHDNSAHRH